MTADGRLLLGFGLRIRSTIDVPGACADPDPDPGPAAGGADIEILTGEGPSLAGARAVGNYRVASADLFDFTMPGLARFVCVDRSRIVVEPAPGADFGHVCEMLVATALPALLWARREVVLHAAVFVPAGASSAVAIAGASGGGKSTALARAFSRGADVVSDDSARIVVEGSRIVVAGLPGGYYERSPGGAGRTFRAVPPERRRGVATLGAILALSPDLEAPRRLFGAEALLALLRNRHRPRVAGLLGLEPDLFPDMAAIARGASVVSTPAPLVDAALFSLGVV